MGSAACLLVLMIFAPPPASLAEYASVRGAMAAIGEWIYLPSMALTLIAGLLAIAANRAFQNAGWAWVKLATGIVTFEGSLYGVLGPIQEEAKRSADALAAHLGPEAITAGQGAQAGAVWMMLAVMTANVVFGIWRPRLSRIPD